MTVGDIPVSHAATSASSRTDRPSRPPAAPPVTDSARHRIGVLCRHNLVLVARDPHHVVAYVVMPMVLLTMLRPLYTAVLGREGGYQATAGMLVMFSLLALNIVATAILAERSTWRTWDRLRATPARPAELLVGKALPLLAVLLGQQVVVLGFGALTAQVRLTGSPLLLPVASLAWGVAVLACGSALATLARSHGQLTTACDIGSMVMTCLGGALVPLATMPGWARALAPLSPGYWGMEAFQGGLAGDPGRTFTAAGVLLAVATLAGGLACRRMSR